RSGNWFQAGAVAPVAADQQGQVEAGAGFHGQVNALVGDQAAQAQKVAVIAAGRAGGSGKAGGVHRRKDDGGVAAVKTLDAALDLGGDGGEMVHALGGGQI